MTRRPGYVSRCPKPEWLSVNVVMNKALERVTLREKKMNCDMNDDDEQQIVYNGDIEADINSPEWNKK